MTAYYNEFDPKAAAWLRELIKQGHIADGVVDDRSIEDVIPTELAGFTQCHFFAGIGVWSYALRRAGWADDRPVWTGSCPCQPFSAAGKGSGFDDERHLWPAFHHLISQCRPPIVLGEQVASKDGLGWLDLVHADLEATGYSSGAVDLCAAGIGAPHIRQRLWWVGKRLADTNDGGYAQLQREGAGGLAERRDEERPRLGHEHGNSDVRLANTTNNAGIERCELHLQRGWQDNSEQDGLGSKFGNMANTTSGGRQHEPSGEPAGILLGTAEDTRHGAEPGGHDTGNGSVANTDNAGSQGRVSGRSDQGREDQLGHGGRGSAIGGMADTASGGQLGAINARERGTGMVQAQPSRGSGSGGLADTKGNGWDEGKSFVGGGAEGIREGRSERRSVDGAVGSMADTSGIGRGAGGVWDNGGNDGNQPDADVKDGIGMADTTGTGQHQRGLCNGREFQQGTREAQGERGSQADSPIGFNENVDMAQRHIPSGPTNGHWRDADWLFCRDGKWRPVEPGTSPLAHGSAARVGRLRGYGNAIVAQAAQAFIESVMD